MAYCCYFPPCLICEALCTSAEQSDKHAWHTLCLCVRKCRDTSLCLLSWNIMYVYVCPLHTDLVLCSCVKLWMICWQGNGHSRATEQGLNARLDVGIEDRDIFSPLKQDLQLLFFTLAPSCLSAHPLQARVVQIKKRTPKKMKKIWKTATHAFITQMESYSTAMYTVLIGLKSPNGCRLFHLRDKSFNGVSVILNMQMQPLLQRGSVVDSWGSLSVHAWLAVFYKKEVQLSVNHSSRVREC